MLMFALAMHYTARADIFGGGGEMEKSLLKTEKYIFKISHLIFWMPQAANYLIYAHIYYLILLFFCLNVIPLIPLGA